MSPVYCKKKLDSIWRKLTEEIDFEVCPYGESGNGTAAAARRSVGYSDWTGGVQRLKLRGIRNWGRNRAIKTNRLVIIGFCFLMPKLWIRMCICFPSPFPRYFFISFPNPSKCVNIQCENATVLASRHFLCFFILSYSVSSNVERCHCFFPTAKLVQTYQSSDFCCG